MKINRHRILSTLAAACLLSTPVLAHPGSGIAVDSSGQVFFQDTGSGLWKIDTHGKLSKLSGTRYHWLVLDLNNAFANARLPTGSDSGQDWDIMRFGANPSVLMASEWPIALAPNGNLYYQSGDPGHLQLKQSLPSGRTSVLATLPKAMTGLPLPHLNGIAVGPDGSVYYTENTSIRRVTALGRVTTVATVSPANNGVSIPSIGASDRPLLRGIQVNAKGVIFVAAEGDGRLLKITPDGKTTTLVQTQSPWSPTGVALFRDDVYVLEYTHTARDMRSDWLPRIRKITPDGKSKIIATIDMMPGARG